MEKEKIEITTPFIRLGALLKLAGLAQTGGIGSMIIADGLVCVNGEVCLERGRKIRPGDVVTVSDDISLEVEHAFGRN